MCALTLPLPPTLRARWQPWYIAKQKGAFAAAGIELEYTDYPGGTGAMTKALNDNALDVAILLTEGCVKDIATGGAHKIVAVTKPVCLCSCDQRQCVPPCVPAGSGSQSRSQCTPSSRRLAACSPVHWLVRRCMSRVRCAGEYTQEQRKRTSNPCPTSTARSLPELSCLPTRMRTRPAFLRAVHL